MMRKKILMFSELFATDMQEIMDKNTYLIYKYSEYMGSNKYLCP